MWVPIKKVGRSRGRLGTLAPGRARECVSVRARALTAKGGGRRGAHPRGPPRSPNNGGTPGRLSSRGESVRTREMTHNTCPLPPLWVCERPRGCMQTEFGTHKTVFTDGPTRPLPARRRSSPCFQPLTALTRTLAER